LIFQCGLEGPKRTPASITNSRRRLVQLLSGLLPATQIARTTIVFDAQRLPRQESQIESYKHGIRVLFAVGYESADEMIEELIAGHSHPKDLLVVSSDHRIQNAATRRKAKAIDSDAWLDQIEKQHADGTNQTKSRSTGSVSQTPTTKPVDSEVKSLDWKAEFGVDNQQASEELVREIENELGLNAPNDDDKEQDIDEVENDLKNIDWMQEFGFTDD